MTKTQLSICLIASEAMYSSQKNIIAGLDNRIAGLEKELFLERQDSESAVIRSAEIEEERDIRDLEQQAKGVLDAVEYLGWDDLYTDSCPGQNIGRKFRFVAGKLNKEAEALKAGKL